MTFETYHPFAPAVPVIVAAVEGGVLSMAAVVEWIASTRPAWSEAK